ncbi:MAG: hypothetical protein HPY69_12885 [Armatimonadetes bacterium]|nr:hypothetical protein [Armatimonadota bacterium]
MYRPTVWSCLALGGVIAVLASGLAPSPAAADNEVAKVLAAVAVGALVYEALDDDCTPRYCPPAPRYCPPPPRNPRYDPPSNYYNWSTPRQNYDRGYRDGFGDGRDYGRREGYRVGYRDGRHAAGPPGHRRVAYGPGGHCWW